MTQSLPPFDQSDPFETLADGVRQQVASIGIETNATAQKCGLSPVRALEAMIGGTLTGLIGVAFAHIENTPEARNAVEEFIAAYIPQARAQAAAILDSTRNSNGGHRG